MAHANKPKTPGWYPDPRNTSQVRYFDGKKFRGKSRSDPPDATSHQVPQTEQDRREVLLPPAKIVHVAGFKKSKPPRGWHKIVFHELDAGRVEIVRIRRIRGNKVSFWFAPNALVLTVRNQPIRSGGDLVDGWSGSAEAKLGLLDSSVLNELTKRHSRDGLLTFAIERPGAPMKSVVLAFENVPDRQIRDGVMAQLVPFMDFWTQGVLRRLEESDDEKRERTRPAIRRMTGRGLLTPAQLELIEPGMEPREPTAPAQATP